LTQQNKNDITPARDRSDARVWRQGDPLLTGAVLDDYLKRIQKAFHIAGEQLKESRNRLMLDVGGLVQQYLKGRAWVICELYVADWGVNKRAALACHYAEPAITKDVLVSIAPRGDNASYIHGCKKQSMLIDVAQFIQNPEGLPLPTLVCLHFIDEEVMDRGVTGTEASWTPDLTGEAISIVTEWEPNTVCLARHWLHQSHSRIIERASEVADGISNDGVDALVGLMKRIKENFHATFPLIRFKPHSIEICRQKGSDPGLQIRNMIACAA